MMQSNSGACNKIFVYGTLLDPEFNAPARVFHEIATRISEASIQGKLYKISWYPGLILSEDSNDKVYGAVYELHDPVKSLSFLDEYEGDQYKRSIQQVKTEQGTIEAWVYLFTDDVNETRSIPSGRFELTQ